MVWGYRLDLMELQKLKLNQTDSTHAWAQFLENELAWVEAEIGKDIRNNSAWNYRFNIVKEKNISFKEDFEFVSKKIIERENNEASWNYFNGLKRIHSQFDSQGSSGTN